MVTFEVAGIIFHDRPQPGSGGVGFGFSDLIDWYGVPDSKSPLNERPQAHGAFGVAADWRQSAAISFKAFYKGADRVDMLRNQNLLTGALGVGRPVPATLTDELGPTSRVVSIRNARPQSTRGRKVVTFDVDMIAPDPLRYAPAVVATTGLPMPGTGIVYPITYPITYGTPGNPGRVVTENPGTAETFSQLEITGGLSAGFELTEIQTGNVIRFDRLIPDGSTAFVNLRTGRASIDGQSDVSGYLTRFDGWSVPAGGSREIQFNARGVVTGTPTLTARTAPAYW